MLLVAANLIIECARATAPCKSAQDIEHGAWSTCPRRARIVPPFWLRIKRPLAQIGVQRTCCPVPLDPGHKRDAVPGVAQSQWGGPCGVAGSSATESEPFRRGPPAVPEVVRSTRQPG